jgi:hypothetical protein
MSWSLEHLDALSHEARRRQSQLRTFAIEYTETCALIDGIELLREELARMAVPDVQRTGESTGKDRHIDRVDKLLSENPGRTFRPKEVVDLLGISRPRASEALVQLVQQGRAERTGHGCYCRLSSQ